MEHLVLEFILVFLINQTKLTANDIRTATCRTLDQDIWLAMKAWSSPTLECLWLSHTVEPP